MSELTAARTLVKSAPELWAQCSDPESLARHLQAFGEITITRLEPEETVAWEGERASGTVRIEPSGWGTKVTLTAVAVAPDAPGVEAEATAAPVETDAPAARRPGLFARLLGRRPSPPPMPSEPPRPAEKAPAVAAPAALDAALDSLGQAHHRPFSRS